MICLKTDKSDVEERYVKNVKLLEMGPSFLKPLVGSGAVRIGPTLFTGRRL